MKIIDAYLDEYSDREYKDTHNIKQSNNTETYRYKGIEFPTEREMSEYIKNEEKTEVKSFVSTITDKEKRYIVYSNNDGCTLYIAKNGYTVNINAALRMTEQQAASRSHYATINGARDWKMRKIN